MSNRKGGGSGRTGRSGGGLTLVEAARLAELEAKPSYEMTFDEFKEALALVNKRGDAVPASPRPTQAQRTEAKLYPDSQDWESALNPQEQAAVEYYSRDGYDVVNGFLRGEYPYFPPDERRRIRRHLSALDDAIGMGRVSSDVTVYRVVRSESLATLKKGQSFTDPAFTSTSIHKEVAASFATGESGAVFRIKVPKGSRGAYSQMFGEGELMLYRNARFTVTRKGWEMVDGRKMRVLTVELDPTSQRHSPLPKP